MISETVTQNFNSSEENKLKEFLFDQKYNNKNIKNISAVSYQKYHQQYTNQLISNKPLIFKLSGYEVELAHHNKKNLLLTIKNSESKDVYKWFHNFMKSYNQYQPKFYIFNDKFINTIQDSKHGTLFDTHQISDILGYDRSSYLANYYSKYNINIISFKGHKYTDVTGLRTILNRSRKPGCQEMLQQLGLDNVQKIQSPEANVLEELIDFIKESDPDLHFKLQYPVDGYRIDMYIPKHRIAIEVDELGHADRNKLYEQTREEHITKTLKARFLRINPNSPKFRISRAIGLLQKMIENKNMI